jgi:UDPglucose 6-dehydrogenase
VRRGIGSDPRIGYDFLYAGAGYGGSCFPKDVKALIKTAAVDAGIDLKVLTAVEVANDAQKHVLGTKIKARFGEDLEGKHFAVWGLAFKANTDDIREAPAFDIIRELTAAGMRVQAFDPVAGARAQAELSGNALVELVAAQYDALKGADALAVVTDWNQFRNPDFAGIARQLKEPVVFDGRNLYSRSLLARFGLKHYGIGR